MPCKERLRELRRLSLRLRKLRGKCWKQCPEEEGLGLFSAAAVGVDKGP